MFTASVSQASSAASASKSLATATPTESNGGKQSAVGTAGFTSTSEKQNVVSSLLRFGKPLIITDEVRIDDRIQEKNRVAERREVSAKRRKQLLRGTKIMGLGPGKQGFAVCDICMGPSLRIHTGKVLGKIHSPRDWEKRDRIYRQEISNACTTRSDVIAVKEEMDRRLNEFGSEGVGLCKKRRDVFSQAFDEIIRQVSISCAERGKLLLAIRDELNTTFAAYESLFWSAIAHGIRRQLKLQQDIEDWEYKIHQMKERIAEISATYDEFLPTFNLFVNKFNSQMDNDEKDYTTEYERLLKNNRLLKKLLLNCVKEDAEPDPGPV